MNLEKKLKELAKMDFTKSLGLMGVDAISVINERVDSGKEVNGSSFKGYSKEYDKFKKSKGRSGKVDLTFTGEMLNSMQYKVEDGNKLIIDFPRRRHSKNKQPIDTIAEQVDRERPFFDLSEKELNSLTEKHLKKHIDGILNGL